MDKDANTAALAAAAAAGITLCESLLNPALQEL